MNTSIDLKIRLGNSLLKHVVSNYQSSTLEFILAQHIMDMEQGKRLEDSPELMDSYQSLMLDFQGKCDEHIALEATYQERCAEYDTLQEEHDELGSHYDALTATTEQLENSKAALQRDYDQLLEEANSLRAANANGTEVLAKTRDELLHIKHEQKTLQTATESYLKVIYATLKAIGLPEGANIYTLEDEVKELKAANIALSDRYNYVTRSQITGLDDDKSRELIMTLRDIGRHLGAQHENANTIAAWVKKYVPAGAGKTPRPKHKIRKAEPPKVEEFVWVNPPEVGES